MRVREVGREGEGEGEGGKGEGEGGGRRGRGRGREGKRALLHVSFAIERVGHYICTNLVLTFILEHILELQKCLCSHLHKSRDNHLGA